MTAQLPIRERLKEIAIAYGSGHHTKVNVKDDEVLQIVEALLAAHEQEPVGIVHGVAQTLDGSSFVAMVECKTRLSDGTELFSHPAPVPAVSDDWKGQLNCTHCTPKSVSRLSTGTSVGVAPVPAVPDEMRQWIDDVVEYLNGGLEADGELEAEGSIEAKRLLARHAAMLNGGKF